MTTFLTSQQVQAMINVDRSTVYRMAEDGRLPAVKVGRQWRFAADQVADVLGVPVTAHASQPDRPVPTRDSASNGLDRLLPPAVAQSFADLVGEALGTMAVITDMEGRPHTAVANPCGYYSAITEQPGAAELCLTEWRQFADEPHVAPRFIRTRLGFLCARSFIWIDLAPVGMILAGGVRPPTWPPPTEMLDALATEFSIAPTDIADAAEHVWTLDADQRQRVLRLLPQFGDTVSQLASACRHLSRAAPAAMHSTPSTSSPSEGTEP